MDQRISSVFADIGALVRDFWVAGEERSRSHPLTHGVVFVYFESCSAPRIEEIVQFLGV